MDQFAHLVARHGGESHDMSSMNMGQSNSTSVMMMSNYFTTTLGASNLWFSSWTPTTSASTAGACIGLFFLALFSRFLSALKACAEVAWSASLHSQYHATPQTSKEQGKPIASPSLSSNLPILSSSSSPTPRPFTPPFPLAIDLPRSLLFGLQSFVAYLLMLAVMSYSAFYFIAILCGLMVGELWVGRFIAMGRGGEGEGHHGSGDL